MLLIALALLATPTPHFLELPGGPPVWMDYFAYEAKADRLWVPAGNTGRVDVVDAKTGAVTAVEGFATATVGRPGGGTRELGPSSATVSDGFVYVGNRAGNQVCAVLLASLERKGCVTLASLPDGLAFVASTHEVWVTTPRDNSITILDVKVPAAPTLAGRIPLPHPEGYAVDEGRGLFYTNQEEEDRTVAIDVRTRTVVARWASGCGAGGPRGLALDPRHRHLLVACTTKVQVLDAGKNGAVLSALEVGEGLDNIDFFEPRHLVYAAAGKAGTLTVAEVSEAGALKKAWSAPTAEGARGVVVDSRGQAYVADGRGGRLIVFPPLPTPEPSPRP